MRDDLSALARSVALRVVADSPAPEAEPAIASWQAAQAAALARTERMLGELRALPSLDASMLAVALRELRNLA
jgi:glutamate dehydrogenase